MQNNLKKSRHKEVQDGSNKTRFFRKLFTGTALSLAVGTLTVLSSLTSVSYAGSIDANGNATVDVNLFFPPVQSDLDTLEEQMRNAQVQLCDATDGLISIREVNVTTGGSNEANADVWWLQSPGRAYATGVFGTDAGRFVIYGSGPFSSLRADVLAHEMGHLILGLGDEYGEQRRAGACGQGVSIDPPDIDSANNTMMQQADAQFCTNSAGLDHRALGDPRIGPVACMDDTDCVDLDNPAYATDPAIPATAVYDTCSYPDLSSELTVSVNHDPLRATADSTGCDTPVVANRFNFNGSVRPAASDATAFDGTDFDTAAATANFWNRLELFDELGRLEGQAGQFLGESNHGLDVYANKFGPDNWTMIFAMDAGEFDGGTEGDFLEIARFNLEFSGASLSEINGEPVDASGASTASGLFPQIVIGGTSTPPAFGTTTNGAAGQTDATGDFTAHSDGMVPASITLELSFGGISQQDVAAYANGFVFLSRLFFGSGLTELVNVSGGTTTPQKGACTDANWCNAAWNSGTRQFESTAQTIGQILNGAPVTSDWELMATQLSNRYGIAVAVPAGTPTPSENANPVCTQPLNFESGSLTAPDQIMIVLDRSGSMEQPSNRAFAGEETRMQFAQAAARAYVALSNNRPVQVGLMSFASTVSSDVALDAISDATTPLGDYNQAIDALTTGGQTAIATALQTAGDQIDGAGMGTKAILFLSDGEDNPPDGDTGGDPLDVANSLRDDKNITIFAVPVGDSADRLLFGEIAAAARGKVLDAESGNELPALFVEAFARIRGETLTMNKTAIELEGPPIIIGLLFDRAIDRIKNMLGRLIPSAIADNNSPPSSQTFEIPVETGSERLNILLSARQMPVDNWFPVFTLRNPNDDIVLQTNCNECSGIVSDPFFRLLSVDTPTPGTWELTVVAPRGSGVQKSYVAAHVENPGPDCFVDASPRVVNDGQSVQISVSAANAQLIESGVTYTGFVERPDGSIVNLNFSPDPVTGDQVAEFPASALIGRGAYRTFATCSVGENAAVYPGESIFEGRETTAIDAAGNVVTRGEQQPVNSEAIDPFTRTVQGFFFHDSAIQPPLPPGDNDPDNDGIDNDDEPPGDLDGDGRPNNDDDDADGDDIPDANDPNPFNPDNPGIQCSIDPTPLECCSNLAFCPARQPIALFAEGNLNVEDRADAIGVTGEPARVVNAGSGQTVIGVEATTGGLISEAGVFLRERSLVDGNLRTGATLITQSEFTVSGTVVENADIIAPTLQTFSIAFPVNNGGDIHLEPDQSMTLAPGSYANVSVKSRSTLTLSSGTYFVTGLNLEPQASLQLDTSGGPVYIYVQNSLAFKGLLNGATGTNLLIGYFGANDAFIETSFSGTIVAPDAGLVLGGAEHFGSYFAENILVRPDVQIHHRPFSGPWISTF